MDIKNLFEMIVTFLLGSGLTIGIIGKFGQTWFFKWFEKKSALELAEKKNKLLEQLEMKKKDLNKELQLDVSLYKSQIEVLGKQNSKFLEKKIDVILELNKHYYRAMKGVKDYIDYCSLQINQAGDFYRYDIEDDESNELSSYEVYVDPISKLHDDKKNEAYTLFNIYSEFFSLNMPILNETLLKEELNVIDHLFKILEDAKLKFVQTMNTCIYILNPEENETTIEKCLQLFIHHSGVVNKYKDEIDKYNKEIANKSIERGKFIEKMIHY